MLFYVLFTRLVVVWHVFWVFLNSRHSEFSSSSSLLGFICFTWQSCFFCFHFNFNSICGLGRIFPCLTSFNFVYFNISSSWAFLIPLPALLGFQSLVVWGFFDNASVPCSLVVVMVKEDLFLLYGTELLPPCGFCWAFFLYIVKAKMGSLWRMSWHVGGTRVLSIMRVGKRETKGGNPASFWEHGPGTECCCSIILLFSIISSPDHRFCFCFSYFPSGAGQPLWADNVNILRVLTLSCTSWPPVKYKEDSDMLKFQNIY